MVTAIAQRSAGRTCGTCSLCCKLLGIGELDKKPGAWCSKCDPPHGCTIYESRPTECREFACVWLESARLGDAWKPSRSRIVLYMIDGGERLIAHVDAGSPDAWRREPYYAQLKAWARSGIRSGPKVVVRIDNRLIAILPDRDVDLGDVRPGDAVMIGENPSGVGPTFIAKVVGES
ncbi:MAG: hypothetical protein AB7O56_10820 [Bauldia sp.]